MRKLVQQGGFEDVGGYSRAVRLGEIIAVSGTAPTTENGVAVSDDVYVQTHDAFARALAAVAELGGSAESVIRTRTYLAPGADWRGASEAHREIFDRLRPANTTLFVAGFIPEGVLVEVEVDAVLENDAGSLP